MPLSESYSHNNQFRNLSTFLPTTYHTTAIHNTTAAMDSSAAIPASMQTYLNNCTPQQVQDIVQHIQGLSHPNVARDKPSTKVKSGSVVKKQRTKKAKTTTGGPKRPLNSWMAFRKFYEGSLSPATQKAISTVLSNYWRTDPFHAKWYVSLTQDMWRQHQRQY